MTLPIAEILKPDPSAELKLYVLDATICGGGISFISPEPAAHGGDVVWQGVTYQTLPLFADGFEWTSGKGTLPRPKMRVSALQGLVGGLVRDYDDLIAAKLTLKRMFARHLDAVNFKHNLVDYATGTPNGSTTSFPLDTPLGPVTSTPVVSRVTRQDWQSGAIRNLLGYSNKFYSWSISGATVAKNAVGPDGSANSAWTLTDSDAANYQQISWSITVPNDLSSYVLQLRVKKTSGGTSKTVAINLSVNGGTAVIANARLNTDTGAVGGACTAIDGGDGFWKWRIPLVNNGTGNTGVSIGIYPAVSNNGTFVDSPTHTGSCVIANAHFEAGTDAMGAASVYLDTPTAAAAVSYGAEYALSPSPRTCGVVRNQDLSYVSTWGLQEVSILSNASVAPDGAVTLDFIRETATAGVPRYVDMYSYPTYNLAQQITYQAVAKDGGSGILRVHMLESPTYSRQVWADFNLVTGAVVSTNAANGASVLPATTRYLGGGFWLLTLQFTLGGAATAVLMRHSLNGGAAYTGNTTKGVYLWNIDMKQGAASPLIGPTLGTTGSSFTITDYTLSGNNLTMGEAPLTGATIRWTGSGFANQYADPTACYLDDPWVIERKVTESKDIIEFELVAPIDQPNAMVPKARIRANVCEHNDATICPFSVNALCGKKLANCITHSTTDGVGLPAFTGGLPFGAEPGTARIR